jgi:hypothetical protein
MCPKANRRHLISDSVTDQANEAKHLLQVDVRDMKAQHAFTESTELTVTP